MGFFFITTFGKLKIITIFAREMKIYILTYNLRNPGHNYAALYEAIKCNCEEYHHIMESSWLIKTDKTAKEFAEKIAPHFYKPQEGGFGLCDSWFVTEIPNEKNREGFMAQSAWRFLDDDALDYEKARKDLVYFATHCIIDGKTGKHITWTDAEIEQLKELQRKKEEEDTKS